MLKMPQQHYIKFLRESEGLSIDEIASQVKVNWRTAKKYADELNWNASLVKRKRNLPVMGPYMEIVDTWLEEDRLLPRKQRHTGVRIFQRLREEHTFPGGQRTVLAYVSRRRKEMELSKAKTYERLEHPPGEAQVDFMTFQVSKEHQLLTYKLLVLSFPNSNAAFVYPTPAENQECFLEALQQCFMQMGGAPARIWFDNLSAAVVQIEKLGKRQLTAGFQRFCAHYRFEAIFCNPYSGHEKGHVEGKCGYSRRNWAVPIPIYDTHEQLASYFAQQAKRDMERKHYAKEKNIAELWEVEQTTLLVLPEVPYEAFHLSSSIVNKYGEIRIDGSMIPLLGKVSAGSEVLIQAYWDRIVMLNTSYETISEMPRAYTGRTSEIPWEQVIQNFVRKPRSVTHSQFVHMLPETVRRFFCTKDLSIRKERLQAALHWIRVYTLKQMDEGLTMLGEQASTEQLTSMLYLKYGERPIPIGFDESYSPESVRSAFHLQNYDRLMGGALG